MEVRGGTSTQRSQKPQKCPSGSVLEEKTEGGVPVVNLHMDMEHQTGSKSGKEYVKAVYCHPAYLTDMQSNPEKAVAPHSSTLAWKIPWMEEPGRRSPGGR